MAVTLDSGRSRRGGTRWKPKAEINVTPFVDVMLVLLIVFMISAPLLAPGILVDLPETVARDLPAENEPLTITVLPDGSVYLQETEVPVADLITRLEAVAGTGYDSRIFIRADGDVDWSSLADIMARINAAGFNNLGPMTDPVQQ